MFVAISWVYLLGIGIALLIVGVCLWIAARTRNLWWRLSTAIFAAPFAFISVLFSIALLTGTSTFAEKYEVAHAIGATSQQLGEPGFPASYFVAQIVPNQTPREEVHEIMTSAKKRFKCSQPAMSEYDLMWEFRNGRGASAERYFFLSGEQKRAQIANVWYDESDTAVSAYTVDSNDNTAQLPCLEF